MENIPLHLVLDAISEASRNVSILLKRDLENPPIPVHAERKQGDTDMAPKTDDSISFDFQSPESTVEVYEIWKVFLDENEMGLDDVYVVISADFKVEGYKNGNWSNIEYRGFYTTQQEATNEISGYL